MAQFIDISLFKGFHYLAKNSISNETLEEFITQYEDVYLTELLEDKKADFIADCVEVGGLLVPQTEPYLTWYNPFFDNEAYFNEYRISKGIKQMLTGFVYAEFVGSENFVHTPVGFVFNKNENSDVLTPTQVRMIADSRYNDAVRTYNAIKRKINDNLCSVIYKEIKTVFS